MEGEFTIPQLMSAFDVFVLSSVRRSEGLPTVVLEAMNQGLPAVCLKLGGPATLVNESCGCAIDPTGKSVAQVVEALGDALIGLARAPTRRPLEHAARQRCREFSWRDKVVRIYGLAS